MRTQSPVDAMKLPDWILLPEKHTEGAIRYAH